jgi:hypothetical protein
MAPKLGKRIAKAVSGALMKRDQMEMRAVDALLSAIERPRKSRAKTERRRLDQRRP